GMRRIIRSLLRINGSTHRPSVTLLVEQVRSGNNALALEAVEQLQEWQFLQDGTLHEADLSNARLKGARMAQAKLERAVLNGADLTKCYLEATNLAGAKLQKAILTEANLHDINLMGADLTEAVLDGAHMAA